MEKKTRKEGETCPKLTIKSPERYDVYIYVINVRCPSSLGKFFITYWLFLQKSGALSEANAYLHQPLELKLTYCLKPPILSVRLILSHGYLCILNHFLIICNKLRRKGDQNQDFNTKGFTSLSGPLDDRRDLKSLYIQWSHHQSIKYTERILEKIFKLLLTMVGQIKKVISRTSKMLTSLFWEYIMS